jgi:uncharacterized protein (TIGR02271 family)
MVEDGKEADALALMQGRFARDAETEAAAPPAPTQRTVARPATEQERATLRDTVAAERRAAPATPEPVRAAETRTTQDVVIPIVREELNVGKREIDAGGVRITTRVGARPVEKTVTVREETIRIERRVVDRPVRFDDENFRDHTMEMTATSDEPVVGKHAHVVEEIRVHKDTTERVERVHDDLRHTDVDVTDLAGEQSARPRSASIDPAFEFGRQLRARMPDRAWSELEPRAKAKWEQTNPRTWDRFAGSIKAGWEAKD